MNSERTSSESEADMATVFVEPVPPVVEVMPETKRKFKCTLKLLNILLLVSMILLITGIFGILIGRLFIAGTVVLLAVVMSLVAVLHTTWATMALNLVFNFFAFGLMIRGLCLRCFDATTDGAPSFWTYWLREVYTVLRPAGGAGVAMGVISCMLLSVSLVCSVVIVCGVPASVQKKLHNSFEFNQRLTHRKHAARTAFVFLTLSTALGALELVAVGDIAVGVTLLWLCLAQWLLWCALSIHPWLINPASLSAYPSEYTPVVLIVVAILFTVFHVVAAGVFMSSIAGESYWIRRLQHLVFTKRGAAVSTPVEVVALWRMTATVSLLVVCLTFVLLLFALCSVAAERGGVHVITSLPCIEETTECEDEMSADISLDEEVAAEECQAIDVKECQAIDAEECQAIDAEETTNALVDGSEVADAIVVAVDIAVNSGERGVGDDYTETALTQNEARDDPLP